MKNQSNNEPTWITNIYTPEGNDRPSYNPPTTRKAANEDSQQPLTLAEIVAQVNRGIRA